VFHPPDIVGVLVMLNCKAGCGYASNAARLESRGVGCKGLLSVGEISGRNRETKSYSNGSC
jgi:hypothetical protein